MVMVLPAFMRVMLEVIRTDRIDRRRSTIMDPPWMCE